MEKSGKSSNSKNPIVVFIYGPMAAGKLTVANVLSKRIDYKLAHNHSLNDFVDEVFQRGTYARNAMVERLRYDLLESAVRAKINLVTTHCYSHNFISETGLSDPEYVQTLEKKLIKLGAKFYPVHLKASDQELLRRVNMDSRKKFGKLTNKKIMKKFVRSKDWQTSPKLRNNLVIDNTNLSPAKVSEIIIKHFKLLS